MGSSDVQVFVHVGQDGCETVERYLSDTIGGHAATPVKSISIDDIADHRQFDDKVAKFSESGCEAVVIRASSALLGRSFLSDAISSKIPNGRAILLTTQAPLSERAARVWLDRLGSGEIYNPDNCPHGILDHPLLSAGVIKTATARLEPVRTIILYWSNMEPVNLLTRRFEQAINVQELPDVLSRPLLGKVEAELIRSLNECDRFNDAALAGCVDAARSKLTNYLLTKEWRDGCPYAPIDTETVFLPKRGHEIMQMLDGLAKEQGHLTEIGRREMVWPY